MKLGTYCEAIRAGFPSDQAAFLSRLGSETRDEAVALVEDAETVKRASGPSFTTRLFRSWVIHVVDLSVAITAWIFGFGLAVENWTVLIGVGLVGRFVFHALIQAFVYDDVTARVAAARRVRCDD